MKTLHRNLLAAAGAAAAAVTVGLLSAPTTTAAFSTIGGDLGLDQRDFRVWNNFTDAAANNNTISHVNFPGAKGAVMAIWKGHDEWASGPIAGNGQGDGLGGLNPILGDGGANFDNSFQGTATNQPFNSNVHAELLGNGGSVLAFTLVPINDGWTIQYYSNWQWEDGPSAVTTGIDLQGVACHEIGHSLGLGHSDVTTATMYFAITGTGTSARSIEFDDSSGIKSIYGAKSSTKPVILSLSGSKNTGGVLNINGINFSPTDNEVWFTKANNNDGIPLKVLGLAGTAGSIHVTIPFGAADGEVLVKNSAGSTGANLSNAFPLDVGSAAGFTPFGFGVAGTNGVPVLAGAGDLAAGSASGFQIATSGGVSGKVASLFFSLSQGSAPFKGGTLYTVPVLISLQFFVDPTGQVILPAAMPPAAPSGLNIYCQTWMQDPGAALKFSSTNGLKLTVP